MPAPSRNAASGSRGSFWAAGKPARPGAPAAARAQRAPGARRRPAGAGGAAARRAARPAPRRPRGRGGAARRSPRPRATPRAPLPDRRRRARIHVGVRARDRRGSLEARRAGRTAALAPQRQHGGAARPAGRRRRSSVQHAYAARPRTRRPRPLTRAEARHRHR